MVRRHVRRTRGAMHGATTRPSSSTGRSSLPAAGRGPSTRAPTLNSRFFASVGQGDHEGSRGDSTWALRPGHLRKAGAFVVPHAGREHAAAHRAPTDLGHQHSPNWPFPMWRTGAPATTARPTRAPVRQRVGGREVRSGSRVVTTTPRAVRRTGADTRPCSVRQAGLGQSAVACERGRGASLPGPRGGRRSRGTPPAVLSPGPSGHAGWPVRARRSRS